MIRYKHFISEYCLNNSNDYIQS